jgi:hypothetical protein
MARPAGRPGRLQRRGPGRAAAVARPGQGHLRPAHARYGPGCARGVARRRSPARSCRPMAPASRGQPANRSRSAVTSAWLSPTPANLASFIWSSRSPASAKSRPARPDPAAGQTGSAGRDRNAAAQRAVRVIRRLDAASAHTFPCTTSSRSRTGPMSMITGARPRAGISQLQRHLLPAGAVTIHSASPSPMPGTMPASPPPGPAARVRSRHRAAPPPRNRQQPGRRAPGR